MYFLNLGVKGLNGDWQNLLNNTKGTSDALGANPKIKIELKVLIE